MTARRWFVLVGAVAGLIAMVAWIGEIDLGIDNSLSAPPGSHPQPSDQSSGNQP